MNWFRFVTSTSDRDAYLDEVHDSRFLKGLPVGLIFTALSLLVFGGGPYLLLTVT